MIASAIEFKKEHPSADVRVLSADTGVSRKCAALGIEVVRPPDSSRLAEPEDPQARRIRELLRENTELKNRIPKLAVRFPGGGESLSFTAVVPPHPTEDEIRRHVEEANTENPRLVIEALPGVSDMARRRYADEIAKYNSHREVFLTEVEEHYRVQVPRLQSQRATSIPVKLIVKNEGTTPAVNVEVEVSFPEDLVIWPHDWLNSPKRPQPPRTPTPPPRSFLGISGLMSMIDPGQERFRFPILRTEKSEPRNFRLSNLRENNTALAQVRSFRHEEEYSIIDHLVVFRDTSCLHDFSIEWRVSADNVPTRQKGQLRVRVHDEE